MVVLYLFLVKLQKLLALLLFLALEVMASLVLLVGLFVFVQDPDFLRFFEILAQIWSFILIFFGVFFMASQKRPILTKHWPCAMESRLEVP